MSTLYIRGIWKQAQVASWIWPRPCSLTSHAVWTVLRGTEPISLYRRSCRVTQRPLGTSTDYSIQSNGKSLYRTSGILFDSGSPSNGRNAKQFYYSPSTDSHFHRSPMSTKYVRPNARIFSSDITGYVWRFKLRGGYDSRSCRTSFQLVNYSTVVILAIHILILNISALRSLPESRMNVPIRSVLYFEVVVILFGGVGEQNGWNVCCCFPTCWQLPNFYVVALSEGRLGHT